MIQVGLDPRTEPLEDAEWNIETACCVGWGNLVKKYPDTGPKFYKITVE